MRGRVLFLVGLLLTAPLLTSAASEPEVYYFGVINQRSITLTARYWNPILAYLERRSGIKLRLKMGKTAPETTAMTVRGEHDFVYTNHLFSKERDKLGFRVILHMQGAPIRSTIIVREDSRIQRLKELNGKVVVFPSAEAFVGYWVPMDHLLKSGLTVKEVFAGNQEGAMARLRNDRAVDAAAVNKLVLERYAARENFRYRSLWDSEPYFNIPIMVHPRVNKATIDKVRQVLADMANDPEGKNILQTSAALIKQKKPIVFIKADDSEYENYRRFYRETVVKN